MGFCPLGFCPRTGDDTADTDDAGYHLVMVVNCVASLVTAAEIGSDVSWGLLFLHAISGCDTVSAFYAIGKRTAWPAWHSMPHLILQAIPSRISFKLGIPQGHRRNREIYCSLVSANINTRPCE